MSPIDAREPGSSETPARFADHFSGHAAQYARHRPDYPEELFAYLADLSPGHERAWDCATGNGQAAVQLAKRFREVVATDASREQIESGIARPGVVYRIARAEESGLDARSVDLVTAAQALHWFDRDRFWNEARRVLVDRGIVAVWCYDLVEVSPAVDRVLGRFYREIVGPYWPAERALVERGYGLLEFPFEEIAPPEFRMQKRWSLADLVGYVRTWSAVQRFLAARGEDPVRLVESELGEAWGEDPVREARWKLDLRVGRKTRTDSIE